MIESFKLANIATYNELGIQVNDLKEVNFFYGANGCGKTTASNFLTDTNADRFKNCQVVWSNNRPLTTLVYNKAFRDKNFGNSDIAGVFTLGEATTEQIALIKSKKVEQENVENQLKIYTAEHKKKLKERESLSSDFTDKCWSLYRKYQDDFKEALKGFLRKELFRDKILQVAENLVKADKNFEFNELRERSLTILGEKPILFKELFVPDLSVFKKIETDPIWLTALTGQRDVDIAGLIETLGCQDWINHGRQFIGKSDICPFCQKPTIDENFRRKIELFFDTSFAQRIDFVNSLVATYIVQTEEIIGVLEHIANNERLNSDTKLDLQDFELAVRSLESQLKANLATMKSKQDRPSSKVDITSTFEILVVIKSMIEKANQAITDHNKVVLNYGKERELFISDVWTFLFIEISDDVASYLKKIKGLTKALDSLLVKVNESERQFSAKTSELAALSRHTTSVQPAVDEINRLLRAYAFLNFEIVPSTQLENHYVIQRKNGDLAFETLSEGEVTFITFLYFLQLAKGALTQDDVAQSRVVVIDDPISSLDSNVLYIVSAIVKSLIKEVKDGSQVKQLLIFTHNVYFHKEASFQNGRSNGCSKTHFWILRKANNVTSIQPYLQKNPISSSYELMWQELKDRKNRSGITIQNIMRRILENYFKILGKFSDDDIVSKFENHEEQQICLSLLHWINDGSHCIPDDLFVQAIDDQIEIYLKVFRNIFIKSDHKSHYVMMMAGDELFEGENTPDPEVIAA